MSLTESSLRFLRDNASFGPETSRLMDGVAALESVNSEEGEVKALFDCWSAFFAEILAKLSGMQVFPLAIFPLKISSISS
jgi:hypothetical protein